MEKFRAEVDKIFENKVRGYREDKRDKTVYVEIEEFTAEKLFTLSDLLGTGTIRINPDAYYSSGGCDTCDYGSEHEKWIELRAEKVKF